MKTQITLRRKTLLERLRENIPANLMKNIYIEKKGNNELIIILDSQLTATQTQTIKDKLQMLFYVQVEDVEKNWRRVVEA